MFFHFPPNRVFHRGDALALSEFTNSMADGKGIEFDERLLSPKSDETVCAIRTIPLNELHMREFCREHGIVSYLPLKRVWRVSEHFKNGRLYRYQKEVLRPMFTSYLFAKMNGDQKALLWASKKITTVLTPQEPDRFLMELKAVHAFELAGLEQELEFNEGIRENDQFVIESGIWSGVIGRLEKKKGRFKWAVWLDFANQYIQTVINPAKYKLRRLED